MTWETSCGDQSRAAKWHNIKGKEKDKGKSQGNCLRGDTSLLDPKGVQAAELLMSISARETSNRQCAAATTSALFHLLMNSGNHVKSAGKSDDDLHTPMDMPTLPSGDTAGKLHSVERNRGNDKDEGLSENADGHTNEIDDMTKESEDTYAFTTTEPAKLDTGEDYHKLPLSSYCKVIRVADDRALVHRITGSVADSCREGWIPINKLKFTPVQFVPIHVIVAESYVGKFVHLDNKKDEFPYFDAGPNSRNLNAEVIIKVKNIEGDVASISVYEPNGKPAGFGKIGTFHLLHAQVVALPDYTPG